MGLVLLTPQQDADGHQRVCVSRICAANPDYAGYRGRTRRGLPIVCLKPV